MGINLCGSLVAETGVAGAVAVGAGGAGEDADSWGVC